MKNILLRCFNLKNFKRAKNYAFSHKIISLIALLILLLCFYKIYGYFFSDDGQMRYVIAAVERGTITSTVTGTGQVSASSQVEVQAKASGDVVYVGVKSGDTVQSGHLLAQIDSRSAALDLENARIALAKLTQPADKLDILQAQNALQDAEEAKTKAYTDSLNYIDETFVHLLDVMTGLDLLLKNSQTSSPYFSHTALFNRQDATILAYREAAIKSYNQARLAYDLNLEDQQKINRSSSDQAIKQLTDQTYQTAKLAAQALKDASTAVSYVIDQTDYEYRTDEMTEDSNNLSTWISQMTADVANLNSISATLKSVDRTIADKTETLNDLVDGPDALDVQAEEVAVEQKLKTYNDHFLRAPFSGLITKLEIKVGEIISLGMAPISMISSGTFQIESYVPEVNIARLQVGNPAQITLDAYGPETFFNAVIISIDPAETVHDGVSTYKVKLQFDQEDQRVRPGMTANIIITTENKNNVISVPSSAIVTLNGQKFVVVKKNGKSIKQLVAVGSVGILGQTEIISGLKAGDEVVLDPQSK